MLRRIYLTLTAGLLILTPCQADDQDAKALEGTWIPQSGELSGSPFPEAILKTIKLEIKDGKYTVTAGAAVDKGIAKIDSSKKPKEMDIMGTEGPNKGKTIPVIYEIDGDTLKVCYELAGKERPKSFKTESGSMTLTIVYKREKP